MKAVVLCNQKAECREVPVGTLPSKWARVKVGAAGLCGTDVAKFSCSELPENHTEVLGHEFVGRIEEISGTDEDLSVGDFVVGMPIIICGSCEACCQGRENLCVRGAAIGRTEQGAFAEYVDAPLENLFKTPDSPHESYVLADPLAVCVHARNLVTRVVERPRCLVVGDGTIGCLLAWLLVKSGREVDIQGIHPENLQFVKTSGVRVITDRVLPKSYDEVYEAVGRSQEETLTESLRAVKPGGSVVVLGVYAPGYICPLVVRDLFIKEVDLLGANAYTRNEFRDTIGLISQHKDELAAFVSHRFPLSQFGNALALAKHKSGFTMKIVLRMEERL